MATIAADAILGLTTARALRLSRGWSLYLVVAANLPDADYLPGLLVGDPASTHRDIGFHTPWFALAAGLAAVLLHAWWRRRREGGASWRHACWAGVATTVMVLGHLLLDLLALPYWHQSGWTALPAEAVDSVVDAAVLGPVALATLWLVGKRRATGAAASGTDAADGENPAKQSLRRRRRGV